MTRTNKLFFTSILFSCSFGLLACGDDESATTVNIYDESALTALDSLAIPDSLLQSDSLFTWYMKRVEKDRQDKEKSSSSTKNVDSAKESDSKKSSSSSKIESSSSEEFYDLSPQLLPPGGFYDKLTIPQPAPQKGGNIQCFANLTNRHFLDDIVLKDSSLKLTQNTAVVCEEASKDGTILRKSQQTYFINEKVSMPVVALTVTSPKFYSRYSILSCEGQDPYGCPGLMDEEEYPVHVEFFDKGQKRKAWEVDAGISFMGNYSRTYEKKPVAIKMKKIYQEGSIKYPLFDVRSDRKKFKGFNLRNSGNRYVGDFVGDPVLTSIVEGSSVDYQRSRQVIVFYNGVYGGIHDLRERLNEHFVETNYKGIDSKEVDFIKHVKKAVTASGGTVDAYNAMLSFVATNDFSGENNEAYKKLQTLMDIGNYADYLAAQIYIRNADWPSNNVRAWRSADQPFKFVLFDVDQGFGWDWVSDDFHMNGDNMLTWLKHDRREGRTGEGYFANIYVKVLENPDFRRLFINHSAVMLSEYLTYDRVAAALEKVNSQLPTEEIERDLKVFHREYSPYGSGPNHFDKTGFHLLEYGITRNADVRKDYRQEFSLGSDISVTLTAKGNGEVTLDGMKLPRASFTGIFFKGNDMLLEAVSKNGATFVGWSDGSTENPRLVSPANGDEFVAEFK